MVINNFVIVIAVTAHCGGEMSCGLILFKDREKFIHGIKKYMHGCEIVACNLWCIRIST